jgi:serine/threonine-protein kinase
VHRDVTPQNILLSVSGDVKLLDFGVAKSTDQSHATQSGTVKGKLAYMSPEQSRGIGTLDGRSDLFSLGIVLYEMLAGKNPFARPDVIATVMALQGEPHAPLASIDPALAPIDPVMSRLLAKKVEGRPADANEAFEELSALRGKLPRPPKRLGRLVSEHFSSEISGVIKSVADSDVRRALKIEHLSDPASEPKLAPVAHEDEPREEPTEVDASGETPPRGEPASEPEPTGRDESQRAASAEASPRKAPPHRKPAREPQSRDDEPAKNEEGSIGDAPTRIGPALAPASTVIRKREGEPAATRPGSKRIWPFALGGVLVLAGIGFVALQRQPEQQPVQMQPVPVAAPKTTPPAPPAQPAVAEPAPTPPDDAAKPVEPPAEPPKVAEPVAPPAPEPADSAKATASGKKKPQKPEPKVIAVTPEPAVEPAPVKPEPPAPAPSSPLGTVSASGSFGKAKVTLTEASGHVVLRKVQDLVIGLDYNVSGGVVTARLTCEPWAIVSIDGVSRGKTPIALPALGRTPLPIELRRMGSDPVSFVVTADLAR